MPTAIVSPITRETFKPYAKLKPANYRDLTGLRFNRLHVLSANGNNPKGASVWRCQCECGTVKDFLGYRLTSGRTQSCGCLVIDANSTHGQSKTPLYKIWKSIKARCTREKDKAYASYGARGINICDRWLDSFESFHSDMGDKPSAKHSVERIDNDGDYSPENCRWATNAEQSRNKRNNNLLTFEGKTLCVTDWAEAFGLKRGTLTYRIAQGWSAERALTTPARKLTKTA